MGVYKCSGCGKVIDTIPKCCSEDMIYNQEKNRFECNMGPNCGYLPCLLYTSPSPRDATLSRMPSSA